MKSHFLTMARYNRWANGRIYDAAGRLAPEAFARPMGAFFGSLSGTLNHIMVADCVWLNRITGDGPQPTALDEVLHADLPSLRAAREALDERLLSVISETGDTALAAPLLYRTMAGTEQTTRLSDVLFHVFNHQTHHRGQAHTLLGQLGQEPPAIDLIYFLRNPQG